MRGPISLLKASFSDISQRLSFYLTLMVALGIFALLSSLSEPYRTSGVASLYQEIAFLALTFIYMVMNILTSIALLLGFSGQASGVMAAYKTAWSYFFRYLGLSILVMLIVVVGYLLLIVPGVIFNIWFLLAAYVLVLENTGIVEAMRRSRNYVKGKWWAVFQRAVIVLIIAMVFFPLFALVAYFLPENMWVKDSLATMVSLIVTVVGVGYFYNLYTDIKGSSQAAATSMAPTPNYSPDAGATMDR